MGWLRILTAAVVLAAVLSTASCADESSASEGIVVAKHMVVKAEGRDKKMDKMMKDIVLAFSMIRNMMSMVLMFVTPIIQIKGFGLNVINTLINIARFFIMIQNSKKINDHVTKLQHVNIPHHEPPHWHPHKNPPKDHKHVFIIKDQEPWPSENHGQSWKMAQDDSQIHDGSWGSGSNGEDHSWSANKDDPVQSWNSPPEHVDPQPWGSSHYTYYAQPSQPPQASASSVLRRRHSPQEALPPARPSYVSSGLQHSVYPYFSANLTRLR